MSGFDSVSSSADVEEDLQASEPGKAKALKVCGVCGDKAKGMHFGGVCCDSCKAFFRRSVQNGICEVFFCSGNQCCVIDRNSRKACQYCRFQKCKANGMEPSWVMTEDDRKGLLARRLERKKQRHQQKQQTEQQHRHAAQTLILGKPGAALGRECLASGSGCGGGAQGGDEGKMSELQGLWQSVFSLQELPTYVSDHDANIAERLFDLVRQCVEGFVRSVPEFDMLCERDQEILLENGVPPASILYCAHQFDPQRNVWPRNLHSRCKVPVLPSEALRAFIWDEGIFDQFLRFFVKTSRDLGDEGVVLLLLLIVFFNPDEPQLQGPEVVDRVQTKFTMLLQEQLVGMGTPTFSKLLMRLVDVRHLAEFLEPRLNPSVNTSNVGAVPFTSRFDSTSGTLHPKKLFMKRSKVQSSILDESQPHVSSSSPGRAYIEYNGTYDSSSVISTAPSAALVTDHPISAFHPVETKASPTTNTKEYPRGNVPSSSFCPGISPALDHYESDERHDGLSRSARSQLHSTYEDEDFAYPHHFHPGRRAPPPMYAPRIPSSKASQSSSSSSSSSYSSGGNLSYNDSNYPSHPFFRISSSSSSSLPSCSSSPLSQSSAPGRQDPSPSPLGSMCQEFDRLHAEPIPVYPEDARVIEAARDILPPHLLRQLAKKLQNIPREKL